MRRQYEAILQQNEAIVEQNTEFRRSVSLARDQYLRTRRTELIRALYMKDTTGEPVSDSRTRSEAVGEFVGLERERLVSRMTISPDWTRCQPCAMRRLLVVWSVFEEHC